MVWRNSTKYPHLLLLMLLSLFFLRKLIADLTASSLEEGKRKGTRHFLSASPVSLKNELGPAARGFHRCYIQ